MFDKTCPPRDPAAARVPSILDCTAFQNCMKQGSFDAASAENPVLNAAILAPRRWEGAAHVLDLDLDDSTAKGESAQ